MSGSARMQTAAHRRAWRAFWALVLLCHAPLTWHALATLWSNETGSAEWARLMLLSACNLFFLLEIIFAPCLRLVADRRTAVALLLIVAILHTGVIQSHMPDVLAVRGADFWIALTIFSAAACIRRLMRLTRSWMRSLTDAIAAVRCGNFRSYSTVCSLTRTPRPIESGWRFSPLRAPPCAAC